MSIRRIEMSQEKYLTSLVSVLPQELREEIINYCDRFAFILDCTELFRAPESMSLYSLDNIIHWAAIEGYLNILKWIREYFLYKPLVENEEHLWNNKMLFSH